MTEEMPRFHARFTFRRRLVALIRGLQHESEGPGSRAGYIGEQNQCETATSLGITSTLILCPRRKDQDPSKGLEVLECLYYLSKLLMRIATDCITCASAGDSGSGGE